MGAVDNLVSCTLKEEIILASQNVHKGVNNYSVSAFYLPQKEYSLRSIILFANVDVSRHILVEDTSVLAKSNMGRREYQLSFVHLTRMNKPYLIRQFMVNLLKQQATGSTFMVKLCLLTEYISYIYPFSFVFSLSEPGDR
jgi:hypothetical protein